MTDSDQSDIPPDPPVSADGRSIWRLLQTRRGQCVAVAALLLLLFVMNTVGGYYKSVTYDEPTFMRYGVNVVNGETTIFNTSVMPIVALNMIPLKILDTIDPAIAKDHPILPIRLGRLVTILFTLGLGLIVFEWSRRLYGVYGGLFSLCLYVFDPNLQGHGRLITADFYAAFFTTLALYTLWRLLDGGGLWRAALAGGALAVAQAAKLSAAFLYPIFILIIAIRYAADVKALTSSGDRNAWRRPAWRCAKTALVFCAVHLAVLNGAYLFNGTGAKLKEYTFYSDLFKTTQKRLSVLGGVPVPFPRPWMKSLDQTKHDEISGGSRAKTYLFGEMRDGRFPMFFAVAFATKTPIAWQLLILLALGSCLRRDKGQAPEEGGRRFRRHGQFILVPVLFYAIYIGCMLNAQLGLRHLMIIFPLLHIFCGRLLRQPKAIGRPGRWTLGGLLAAVALSVLSVWPHYLSYFNEGIGDRKYAYKILADSNLDWGQNEWYVGQYQLANPDVRRHPTVPAAGRMMTNANRLVGLAGLQFAPAWYDWVFQNLDPVDHVAYSYLVFDLTYRDVAAIEAAYPEAHDGESRGP